MYVFKLHPKAGQHVETLDNGEDVEYKAGSTIKTEKELDKMFPGKFLRLSDSTSTEFGNTQPEIPIPSEFTSFNVPGLIAEEDVIEPEVVEPEIPIPSEFAIDKQTMSSINDSINAEIGEQDKKIEKDAKAKAKVKKIRR